MSRRQRLTLLAAICGSALVTIDGSIVNVALPAIERNLGGGLAGQQWVANAYLLSLGSLILLGGSLGDVWGERRVVHNWDSRLRRLLVCVPARALRRPAGGGPRAAGSSGSTRNTKLALNHRGRVRARAAKSRGRIVDADRFGPRFFMGVGPVIAGAGVFLLARLETEVSFLTHLLPALLVFALGLALTVAPLTATVLADVDENDAGVITGALRSIAFAGNAHSVRAFHDAILICAALVAVSGAIGAIGIANPRRDVAAATCAGGQFVVVPQASRPQQA